jgi:hypothetical protein
MPPRAGNRNKYHVAAIAGPALCFVYSVNAANTNTAIRMAKNTAMIARENLPMPNKRRDGLIRSSFN